MAQKTDYEKEDESTDKSESLAVTVARAHIEAWSNHNWEKARESLAPDIHVTATTTQPIMAATDLRGIDNYMEGLKKFTQAVVPGSARITSSIGDESNALVTVTVRAAVGPGRSELTLPGARLYLIDENRKIKSEQVIFCVLTF